MESTSGLFSKDKLDLGTRILLENLILPESGTVADVGCGYGPIGIFIALKNPNLKVYMLDVDKKAVYFSSRNVKRYKLDDRVFVIRSDIFSALPKEVKFNGIYSNPPLKAGKEFIIRLANESHERLEKGGIIELVVYKGEENVINEFKKYFDSKVLKREKGYSIILAVKY
ncbi:MAG: methyltransferase [Sulfolobaceae archaeon]|nr:methyltransferase [Sulfolobaceae archaeon]